MQTKINKLNLLLFLSYFIILISACNKDDVDDNIENGVVDIEGNQYNTVVLNNQEWMVENLRTSKYANGDPILNVTTQELQSISTAAWTYYENNEQYDLSHGKLYNWYAADDSRNVCPTGWHVPSLAEFIALIEYLDPNTEVGVINQVTYFTSIQAGGKIKSTGTSLWNEPNTGATNESGLAATPSGYTIYGFSSGIGNISTWWSASSHPNSWGNAQALTMEFSSAVAESGTPIKTSGRSIRCIKN